MKKIISKIACALLVFTVIVSCNSDDNGNNQPMPEQGRAVEYKLTTSAPTIISIHYINAEGNYINVSESFVGMTAWSKTIRVPDGPLTAGFSFEAESPAGTSTQYTMQIFVDGELKQSRSETVTGSTNRDVSYELE